MFEGPVFAVAVSLYNATNALNPLKQVYKLLYINLINISFNFVLNTALTFFNFNIYLFYDEYLSNIKCISILFTAWTVAAFVIEIT